MRKDTHKKRLINPLIILVSFMCQISLSALGSDTLFLEQDFGYQFIQNNYIKFYKDTTNVLSFDEVKTEKYESLFTHPNELSIVEPNTTLWLKFITKNKSHKFGSWVLSVWGFSDITVYVQDSTGKVEVLRSGIFLPESQKQLRGQIHESNAFHLLSGESKTIYIKAFAPVAIKIQEVYSIYDWYRYYAQLNYVHLSQGVFHGLLIMMLIYNLSLFFVSRRKSYLYYVLYILSIVIFLSTLFQYIRNLFMPENPEIAILFGFSIQFTFIFYYLLMGEFIDSKTNYPKLDRTLKILIRLFLVFSAIIIIFRLFDYFWYALLSLLFIISNTLFIFFLNMKVLIKGARIARIFSLGSFFLFSGTFFTTVGVLLGYNNNFLIVIFELGILTQAIVYTFGLGHKYRINEKEIEKAKDKLIIQLKENDLLQTKVTRELEQKVQERTHEINQKKAEIEKENKIKDTLIGEIHHRVKNNLQTVSSLIYMQLRGIENDFARKNLVDIQVRINSMALVHEMLYSDNNFENISIEKYIYELVQTIDKMINNNKRNIDFQIQTDNLQLSISRSVSIGMFTSELISNSIKYAFEGIENPSISIKLTNTQEFVYYEISDNGIGFKTEQNTKNSLGMKLIDIFARQLKAQLEIQSNNGVKVKLTIPKSNL